MTVSLELSAEYSTQQENIPPGTAAGLTCEVAIVNVSMNQLNVKYRAPKGLLFRLSLETWLHLFL